MSRDQTPPSSWESTSEGAALLRDRGEEELRQLTVMFCDLVGSTALSERMDPEDWSEVLRGYQEACVRAIGEFEGHVAQLLGDGILAYFGYPQAHEDDPERAVRAGLRIINEMERVVNPRIAPERKLSLAVRVAIHTGKIWIGALGDPKRPERLAIGKVPNLAARLQGIAEPNTVVISGNTARLVRGMFITRDLGDRSLAGIDEPVPTYQVVQPSGMRSRLDVAAAAGLTPLVGREPDLERLTECWERASRGHGQVVLIEGEAGVGKSRLVYALRDRLAEWHHTWLECHGSRYHENSAFHPVIELLRQGLRLTAEQPAEEQAARIERGLDRAKVPLPETVPLFADLLSIPLPARYEPLELSPEGRRRKTLEALADWLFALAKLQPTVLAIEDLHWTDPSSLELFGMLVERSERAAILMVATCRPLSRDPSEPATEGDAPLPRGPTFEPPWKPVTWQTRTEVEVLSPPQSAAMVRWIAWERPLPPPVLDQIVKKADGVPLFIEELTKDVLESAPIAQAHDGPGWQPSLSVPSSVQDSLTARLDRLGRAKPLAQLASVLGRRFSRELLAWVSGADLSRLEERLGQLVAAGLLYESANGRNPSYTFKHALIQETAYDSLPKRKRREQHARIARVLETRFPERVESAPEEIARHCEEAELTDEAITYYERAGTRAAMRFANSEAVSHLSRAIDLLHKLPEGPERDRREIKLLVALGTPLVAATAWGSDAAERWYLRARELCEQIGEAPQLFFVIRGLVTFYLARAELDTAQELCSQLLSLSEGERDSSTRLVAHEHMAILLFYKGEPAAALTHFERGLALHDPVAHRSRYLQYGSDLGVFARCFFAWNLWLLGYPDQARERGREAVELGLKAKHPFSHTYALLWSSIVHVMRRERERARELSEEALAISDAQGLIFFRGGARLVHGWACFDPKAGREAANQAIEEFRLGIAQLAEVGTRVSGAHMLATAAGLYQELGRIEEALGNVDLALAQSEETQQRYWDADLLRIKGELLLQRDGDAGGEGEALLRQALEVSARQQARALELRAATSLCRLLQRRGERDEARKLLAPIYDWFTEGFDTADLIEARDLLDNTSRN